MPPSDFFLLFSSAASTWRVAEHRLAPWPLYTQVKYPTLSSSCYSYESRRRCAGASTRGGVSRGGGAHRLGPPQSSVIHSTKQARKWSIWTPRAVLHPSPGRRTLPGGRIEERREWGRKGRMRMRGAYSSHGRLQGTIGGHLAQQQLEKVHNSTHAHFTPRVENSSRDFEAMKWPESQNLEPFNPQHSTLSPQPSALNPQPLTQVGAATRRTVTVRAK